MEVRIRRVLDYTPKWNDNEGGESPVVFHLRYLTSAELDDCIRVEPDRVTAKGKVTSGKLTHDNQMLFRLAIVSIDNLSVIDEADEKTEIASAADLLGSPGFELLYYEILKFITGMNARVDSKN